MKEKKGRWLAVLLLTLCIFCLPLTAYAVEPPKTPSGPITGDPPKMPGGTIRLPAGSAVITVNDGTNPVGGVTVTTTVGEKVRTATTDTTGKATFSSLPPGTYVFTAAKTDYTGATASVKVTSMETATGTITLVKPSISVTHPHRLEVLHSGTTYTITWTYTGDPGPLDIQLVDIRGNIQSIAANVPCGNAGAGKYDWQINAPDDNYKIRITSRSNSAITALSDPFSVGGSSLTVTGPPPGTVINPGSFVHFRWTYTGNIGPKVRIKVTPVGGSVPVLDIETATANGGYDGWKAPLSATAQEYVIRVESVQNPLIFAELSKRITVTPPSKGNP